MNLGKKNKYYNDMLTLSSIILGLDNLKKGGIFALKTSMKNFNLLSNIVYIFNELFEEIKTFKSTKELTHRSSCYVIGFKYKSLKNNEYINYLKLLFKAYNNGKHKEMEKLSHNTIFDIKTEGKKVERLLYPLIKTQINCIKKFLD